MINFRIRLESARSSWKLQSSRSDTWNWAAAISGNSLPSQTKWLTVKDQKYVMLQLKYKKSKYGGAELNEELNSVRS